MKTALIVVGSICASFVLMIGGCAVVIGAGASSVNNEMEKQEQEQQAARQDKSKAGRVGKAMTNAGTTYKVTAVEKTKTIGNPDVLGKTSKGVFVVVDLELTNNKDETKTFMNANAKLVTSDGKEYETSSDAILALDNSLVMEDMQPDLTVSGQLAYEIPTRKAKGAMLVIDDLWGDGEITFDLGI